MITNRNSTVIPPMYSTICTANRNSAFCIRNRPATPASDVINAMAQFTALRIDTVRIAPTSVNSAKQ